MRFEALELGLDAVPSLRRPVSLIRRHDRKGAEQLRDAASSVVRNLAEGNRRQGRDKNHLRTIAAGSADEALTSLRVSIAWGDLTEADAAEALEALDRLLAITWRLTH